MKNIDVTRNNINNKNEDVKEMVEEFNKISNTKKDGQVDYFAARPVFTVWVYRYSLFVVYIISYVYVRNGLPCHASFNPCHAPLSFIYQ